MVDRELDKLSAYEAMLEILQRLAGECQEHREKLPESVRVVLTEWENFIGG